MQMESYDGAATNAASFRRRPLVLRSPDWNRWERLTLNGSRTIILLVLAATVAVVVNVAVTVIVTVMVTVTVTVMVSDGGGGDGDDDGE